ncbi:hypothetical protein GGI12_004206, partial [Dipsacomyces acuminosporus]
MVKLLSIATAALTAAAVSASPAQHVFSLGNSPVFHEKAESSIAAARYASPELVNPSQWSKVTAMDAFPDYQLRVKSPKLCDLD